MWSRLVLLLWLPFPPPCFAAVRIGRALNVFNSFGDLGPVLVANEREPDISWTADRDAVDVFQEINATQSRHFRSYDSDFGGDFQLELCDDLTQLQAALFRPFSVEGCERSWRLFSGAWGRAATALKFGLHNYTYVAPGRYAYALARLTRPRVTVSLTPDNNLRLNNRTCDLLAATPLSEGVDGDREALRLLGEVGTHYLAAYTTGETLHQVFVFSPEKYREVGDVLLEYQHAGDGIEKVLDMFDPRHVEHFGKIASSSGNTTLEWWLAWILGRSSLLSLYQQPDTLRQLDRLLGNGGGAAATVVSAELRSLPGAMGEGDQARWLREVLDNQMQLWEINV